MDRLARVVAVAAVLVCLIALVSVGRQLVVSKDGLGTYRSVQAALNEAEYGDTILVNPGVYEETIEFVNGVTVIGSGSDHTIIRYGYGFDEVFHAKNIVSGRIEGVTLERLTSVLSAPVVVLESAALTFSECVITGGQEEGVRITGLSARPLLEDCQIVANGAYGILCEAGAVLQVDGGSIEENAGAGIYVLDAEVEVDGTRFDGNGVTGLVLAGASEAALVDATFENHAGWGIDASGVATAELGGCRFAGNAAGGLRLSGAATADLQGGSVVGGSVGIEAREASALGMRNGTIRGASSAGIRLSDEASCRIERTEIYACSGDGIALASAGPAEVRFTTIVRNGGDGIDASGTTITVTDSIVSLNEGAGIRASQDPSAASPPTFGYNSVWGNGSGDYVGTTRRPSDLAAYPDFVDLADGDLELRLDSPCIGAGEREATIGAHVDPTRDAGASVDMTVRRGDGVWGLDLVGGVRLASEPPYFEEARLRAGRRWTRAAFSLESVFLVVGPPSLRADGFLRLLDETSLSEGGSSSYLGLTLGFDGALDGTVGRSAIWAKGEISADGYALRGGIEWDRTAGVTFQELGLRLGRFSLEAEATAFTLNRLDLGAHGELLRPGGTLFISGIQAMLPERQATLHALWETDAWSLGGRIMAYLEDLTAGELILTWFDTARGSQIDLIAEVADRALSDAALRAEFRIEDLSIQSEIGVNTTLGARFRLSIELDTESWFVPRTNLPPIPIFGYGPFEPEAGEPVIFDASETTDPDGSVAEYWWDFGDGTAEIGNPISHTFEEPGEYSVVLTVADGDGDTATLVRPIQIFEADTTPVASFTWGPVSAAGTNLQRPLRAGDRVRFDAGPSYDPDGTIVEYAWDFESDGTFDVVTSDAAITIDPLAVGTWPVTLRVVDGAGRADAIMRVLLIEEPKPPEAAFDVSPPVPSIFDPVRFIDRSAGVDGSIVSWEWTFGDGHASREREPMHRYEEVGRYEVGLTVTDSTGLADTQAMILEVRPTPDVVPVANVWALIIGIADYEEIEDLPFAQRDAEAMVRWLLGNGVPAEQIRLLTGAETELSDTPGLHVARATLVNVREGLGWLRRVASQDDLVLIHFSGHGYQGADDGTDEVDGVDEFFVLHDTRSTAKDDTALRDDEFGRFLDRIASDHVLIFFDSCYSGGLSRSLPPGRRASGDEEDWFGDLRLEGRLVLAASSEGEEAFESPQLEHGVFTHFLLEGLNGAADLNGDYHVTVWELYEYVATRVPDFVATERGEPQHPQLLGEGETRIILALKERPLEAEFSYCPSVPYAGGPILFLDETASPDVETRQWDFGDGASVSGARVEHVFREEGAYRVTLTVSDGAGQRSGAVLEVLVASPGRIVAIGDDERALISLGARNGLRIGDRLVVDRSPDEGDGILEVIELIDEDRASCRVLDGAQSIRVDDRIVPIDPPACAQPVGTPD